MNTAVIVALSVFAVMVLISIIVVIAVASSVSSFEMRTDE